MWSSTIKGYPMFVGMSNILSTFVKTTTTHGVRRMTYKGHPVRRAFWVIVFLSCLTGCIYHCSHLISTYISAPKMTITEEKEDNAVIFPSLTICNLNVIKREYADNYFNQSSMRTRGGYSSSKSQVMCFQNESSLIAQSDIDLSDAWLNIGITKDNLSDYGHQAKDLIVTCTFNSNDCFNKTSTFEVKLSNVSSPIFGLCHTMSVKDRRTGEPYLIRKPGISQGLRLTLNIEKAEYWNLISPEYGVRLLIHPQNTYPTLQRGGLVSGTGTSVNIGIKRVISNREPGHHRDCFESYEESQVVADLSSKGLDFDLASYEYTNEHCNILCRNSILLQSCNCLDIQSKNLSQDNSRFCDPCNKKQSKCRAKVLRKFSDGEDYCDVLCKPACRSIRYDIRTSYSTWPNNGHQMYIMKREPSLWAPIFEQSGIPDTTIIHQKREELVNSPFFRENLLRVHIYVRELSFLSIEERYSYTLPKLLADLGGCLGLYLGVSAISIIELIELFGNMSVICFYGTKVNKRRKSPGLRKTKKKKPKKKNGNTILKVFGSNYSSALTAKQHRHSMSYRDRKRDTDLYLDSDKWGRSAYDDDYYYNRAANKLDIPRHY